MMRFMLCGFLFLPVLAYADCVILLHGLNRSSSSMHPLAQALTKQGYDVVNQGYPSRDQGIPELAEATLPEALQKCPANSPINVVTHSLGAILLRQYLAQHHIENLARVVMLGPPNQGSEVVDTLADVPGFYFMNGPAGMQLGTGELSRPQQLGAANFEVGIIAGSRSINWILSSMIPGPDDGKVGIERTKLEGMKEHIVMPVTHPFMMKNKDVIQQVVHFLVKGVFQPNESAAETKKVVPQTN